MIKYLQLNYGADVSSLDSGLNDKISSIKFFGALQIILYKENDGFRGDLQQITTDQPNLGASYPNFDNAVSALQVRDLTWKPSPRVCVYTEPDYKGVYPYFENLAAYYYTAYYCFEDGEIRSMVLGGRVDLDNKISSVKVFGGAQVILYRDMDFAGDFLQIKTDQANLGISYPGWDNAASSLKVRPSTWTPPSSLSFVFSTPHPYANNVNMSEKYQLGGKMCQIKITGETERSYDFVYVTGYDSAGNIVYDKKESGELNVSDTVSTPLSSATVRFTSDTSETKNGVTVEFLCQ